LCIRFETACCTGCSVRLELLGLSVELGGGLLGAIECRAVFAQLAGGSLVWMVVRRSGRSSLRNLAIGVM